MEKRDLPVFGVGPFYVIACLVVTMLGLILSRTKVLASGAVFGITWGFIVTGIILMAFGIILWLYAVVIQKISREIKKGTLVTTGVYSIVRNPIYSAFFLLFTGALITACNLYLLILPLVFYLSLTILLKRTEEKWLAEKFGDPYRQYCSRVNRVIPWIGKR